uniref:Major facilitator superfamily (MFS) profile domain-containing protein n=1 Tax=Chromera velia CCMP2878 TaxID=1169474 RepID=A0A0G4GHP7_9ALVE|eukprot:Cvel_21946.t1-p1 / transcript=Cvel_21946.t1 / gene=Cvel_21946 / organism=Chromera_velia_CCMP2878 / gene_product=hypothetical protein / transcript_product=hypothetical protein / location=Cvel_scaffold2107:871-2244(-) / protein_length=458 / sequence_SO=supercontig / SO=protein_coding / is_pseudo=false
MTASLIYAVALERSKGGEGEVGGLFSAFNSLGFLLGPPIGGVLFQVGGVSLPFAAVGGFVLLSTPLLPWLLRFPSPGSATQTAPTETSEVQGNLREGLLAGGIEVEPRLLVDSIEDKGEGGTVKYGRKAREGFCESDLEGCVHAEGENNSKDPQSGIFSLLQDPYQLLILTTEVLCCLPWGFLEPLLSNHLQRGLGVKDSRVIGLVWMVPSITLLLFSWPVGRLTDLLPTAWQEKEVSIGLLGMAAGLYLLGVADELGSSFSLVTGSESKSDSAAWGLTLGGLLLMGASFNVTTVPLTPLSVKAVGVGEEEGELQGEETDRDKEAQKGSHPAEATTPAASLEVRHGQPGVDFESAHVPSTALTARVGSNLVRSVSGGSGRRVSVGAGDSGGIDGVVAMGAVSYGLGEGVGPMIGGLAGEYFSFSESCKLLALSLVGFSVAFFCAAPLARNRGEVQRTI